MMVYQPSQRQMAPPAARKSSSASQSRPRGPSQPRAPSRDDDEAQDHKPVQKSPTLKLEALDDSQRKQNNPPGADGPDAFETNDDSDNEEGVEITRASVDLDELPIELMTLIDSFIESLGAKVHSSPPNIDKLSQLFQDFYAVASSHINTHIRALASKQSRDASPAASASSLSSATSRLRSKTSSSAAKDKLAEGEQQMITTEELADRKRARRALEARRSLLEEVVERRLCEKIYDRIYRHRSTQDEAHDDKLRSKTAALALVGIGPSELGIDLGEDHDETPESRLEKVNEIRRRLGQARKDLVKMHESRYPLGKVNHLKAAHKSIVDTLAHFHPSASADEIMPMLIYTLITLPPESLDVISDIHFIQCFRWERKLTGEAAYCITNLEAAISFLQTVDLATLRADEQLAGPPKSRSPSQPGTPKSETFPPAYPQGLTVSSQSAAEANTANVSAAKPAPSPSGLKATSVLRNRRLSDLINTPAQAFGAASDAVFTTADQRIKTISNSLGDSYKFLLGKLREHQDGPAEPIVVPRTLDDARKLISTPPPEDDDAIVGAEDEDYLRRSLPREERLLSVLGGRGRDPSQDSNRSASSSSRRTMFGSEDPKAASTSSFPNLGQNPAVLEQMRNLGSTFNPMARLSNIPMIRGFGRNVSSSSTSTPAPATGSASTKEQGQGKPAADGGDLATAFPDIAAALPPKRTPKLAPPNKRFMELQTPADLKLGEVLELLRDYRRLADALKNMDAFEEK